MAENPIFAGRTPAQAAATRIRMSSDNTRKSVWDGMSAQQKSSWMSKDRERAAASAEKNLGRPAKAAARARKKKPSWATPGPQSSWAVQEVPSVKANLNAAARKAAGATVSKVSVDAMGNASFIAISRKDGAVRKITFDRGGGMTVEDQPRDAQGRWV